MDKPIVLVLSVDPKTDAESLIGRIRKVPTAEGTSELVDGITGYSYHIRTKYYETDVLFCAGKLETELSALPETILKQLEGILIYFDASERDFLKRLPEYATFLEDNDIEFGILLCTELHESSDKGITYEEAKQFCKVLDVIELEPSGETEDGEAAGVDELIQALHNFIWSNVNMSRKVGEPQPEASELDVISSDADEQSSSDPLHDRIEEELLGFEKLLTQVMQFRPNTSTWSRNERLAYAQEFADIFDELIGGEEDELEAGD
ncbi:alpha- and gamma-adaptin-binding protein p34 isoform X2 [Uranotaenia lowii]|uniref:alpha- and gamma-adaptin-binding protein p34 isoform X2 n=1 Tax=Uranotaenia lowii TaxID=190385 RepID=UPI002478EF6F|nr:alpha- and gamma-adaptin-binding protein p34 isoform X2 [Uranotaenia lowii]